MFPRLTEAISRTRDKRDRGESGFTLIELLVVIVVLGLLASVVVVAVTGIDNKGQTAAMKQDVKTLRTAQEAFYAKNKAYTDEGTLVDQGFLAGGKESTIHDIQGSPVDGSPPYTSYKIVCAPGGPCGAPASPVYGGTLIVAGSNTATVLNPAVTSEGTVHSNSEDMFNGLLKWDAATNQPVGDLADTFDVDHATASGGANTAGAPNTRCTTGPCTTAVFTLNPNVKWHDGADVTPADVEFTFEKALMPFHSRTSAALAALGPLSSGALPADSITISGDTLQFNFTSVAPALTKQLNVTEAPIIPKHVYEPCSTATPPTLGQLSPTNACPANRAPVGSGPFKFSSVNATQIKTVKNPLYTQFRPGLPYLEGITKQTITGSVATALENGTVDLGGISGGDIGRIRSNPSVVSTGISRSGGGTNCLQTWAFNTTESRRRNTSSGVGKPLPAAPYRSPNDADEPAETSRTVSDGVTNTSQTVTSATANFVAADRGSRISGGSIPAEAEIVTVTNANSVVISAPATASASGVSITITSNSDATHLAGQSQPVGTNAPPHRILGDASVREAIFKAFDRQKVVTDVLFNAGRVADSPFHKLLPGYVPQTLPTLDRAAANAMLDSAGWNGGLNGSGFRTALNHPNETNPVPDLAVPDGTELKLTAIYSSPGALDTMAQLLKADLKLIGINLVIEPANNANYLAPKVFFARDFDMVSVSYCNGDDPFGGVRRQWHSDQVKPTTFSNASGYKNATMDAFWDTAASESTDAQRADNYLGIQQQAVNGPPSNANLRLPAVWIYESQNVRGNRSVCAGFNHNNTGLYAEGAYCKK